MRRRWGIALAIGVLAVVAVSAWALWRPASQTAGVLQVSGRVEGEEAAVGAKVGGRIVRVTAREGQRVEAGELIAELASDQLRAELQRAEHVLHTARAQLAEAGTRVASAARQADAARIAVTLAERESRARIAEAEAALGTARARWRQAQADQEKVARDYRRHRELFAKELIAAQQLDEAKAADAVAAGAVDAAGEEVARAAEALELARASTLAAQLRQSEAQTAAERVREARAGVETARAQIQTAEAIQLRVRADLDDARVIAPFAGTVLRRLGQPGEVVAPGTPLVTLVDLGRLYAKVYVAEIDLGKVKVGDPARVYTDAFPKRKVQAIVSEVSQQAEFTPRDVHMKDERVKQVFAVKLAIRDPEGVLKPGMPVDARVRWVPEAPWGDGLD
jgi:HlyD family secretion protein